MAAYAFPDMLVSTDWVEQNLNRNDVRLVEVDVDTKAYDENHVPGAVGWAWDSQLCDNVRRDIVPREKFEQLMGRSGITRDTTVVLYGDNNNWFAAWALWQLEIYGHDKVKLMDGGRKKWLAEKRPLTRDLPAITATTYKAANPDFSIRAYLPQVQDAIKKGKTQLVDVRSPQEYSGEVIAPPGMTETAQRGGHIPGARNIPWSKACNDDGTFKQADDLKQLYAEQGITGTQPVITYCRIGERSSHTWFVLKYLLGYDTIQNYDGSWTEWGNLVGASIEKGAEQKKAA